MALDITTTTDATTTCVSVAGEVDVSNASELRSALEGALAQDAPEIEVDMAQVPYIDSTGIGVLVGCAHTAKDAGKRLTIARPQRNVSRVLGLLGVSDELNVRE